VDPPAGERQQIRPHLTHPQLNATQIIRPAVATVALPHTVQPSVTTTAHDMGRFDEPLTRVPQEGNIMPQHLHVPTDVSVTATSVRARNPTRYPKNAWEYIVVSSERDMSVADASSHNNPFAPIQPNLKSLEATMASTVQQLRTNHLEHPFLEMLLFGTTSEHNPCLHSGAVFNYHPTTLGHVGEMEMIIPLLTVPILLPSPRNKGKLGVGVDTVPVPLSHRLPDLSPQDVNTLWEQGRITLGFRVLGLHLPIERLEHPKGRSRQPFEVFDPKMSSKFFIERDWETIRAVALEHSPNRSEAAPVLTKYLHEIERSIFPLSKIHQVANMTAHLWQSVTSNVPPYPSSEVSSLALLKGLRYAGQPTMQINVPTYKSGGPSHISWAVPVCDDASKPMTMHSIFLHAKDFRRRVSNMLSNAQVNPSGEPLIKRHPWKKDPYVERCKNLAITLTATRPLEAEGLTTRNSNL
jgi:hypothetical protein